MKEPYRLFFPLGIISLVAGALLWVPLLWNHSDYPVLLHRYLMLNGFLACFIVGFLMTALPKFAGTFPAARWEVITMLVITLAGLIPAALGKEQLVLLGSSMQPALILLFMLRRMRLRKVNPPFSFIFIFLGLLLWLGSGVGSIFFESAALLQLHYEGAITSIILGVGSRLIPGILGHVEVVQLQRQRYEQLIPLIKTIPLHFLVLMLVFLGSYFIPEQAGAMLRFGVVAVIAFFYWKLTRFPQERSALTWNIWLAGWLIVLSFALKAVWFDGMIHASHGLFIGGMVLLSLLVATRVLQAHGPQDKLLENSQLLYLVAGLLLAAAATRIFAFIMPELYLSHLAYSSIMLVLAVLIWSFKYLVFVTVRPVNAA
jgi:uncharacterized protein involved in response to NO